MKLSAFAITLPLWAGLLLLNPGCRTAPPGVEKSVKPGINTEYLRPDLKTPEWVERLEKEGREVYDNRQLLVDLAKLKPGAAVADIGAGTGLFTPMLSDAVCPKGTVYAVDIVPAFLQLIQERAEKAGRTNVKTVLCEERSVKLPKHSIDVAFICDAYHHFEYPASTLASLHAALRPGGEVLLIDFKRIPGVSSDWMLNHVRAGQEVVVAEFAEAGFHVVEEFDLLKDNYILQFKKAAR